MKIYKTMENGVQIMEYDDTMASMIADMWNKSGDSWGGSNSVMTAAQVISNYSGGTYYNIFVAIDNDEAVGVCTFARYYNDADTTYVSVLNVRPDYHGKKVGKELVIACVNKTIEMGYPRVDIHTWAGNTKAVPLYKKCGFLWEDRGDTTHLSNYIPTVLKTELFSDFFTTADWYADSISTKNIEIKPDGIKINKFEVYGYSWTKDGKNLAVGFEKTGRRIRFVETDDYKIEFMAENHELAFGLNYNCTFKIENKSGNELNLKIVGKDDKGIKFEYAVEEKINEVSELNLNSTFYVEPIEKDIDIWKMHPCVLADVYINGKHVEFGLGIEPKYPLNVNVFEKRHGVTRPGIIQNVYINVKSMLPRTAQVEFSIPENNMTRFFDNNFNININPEEIVMLSLKEEILTCGYGKVDINYSITLDNGEKVNFSKPLHLINQSVDGSFSYETEHEYCIFNGLWKLGINKQSNFTFFHATAGHGYVNFRVPKFGKPYSDEFDLIKASDVRIYKRDNLMILEVDLESNNFKGVVLTKIYEFSASGVVSRHLKVINNSEKAISSLYLQEQIWSNVGRRCIFHYDGQFHEVKDNTAYAFGDIDSEKIDENWIFDNSVYNKSGVYWDKDYKPQAKWGDELIFEHEINELAPNTSFETKPFVYMSGVFTNVREFRNYVLGIDETIAPYTYSPLEINVNGYNPFINTNTDKIEVVIKNNRLKLYGGDIKFNSSDGLFNESIQTNPDKDIVEQNKFNLVLNKKSPGIYLTDIDFKFQIERYHKRVFFIADKSSKVTTDEQNGNYIVDNGKLCYKVAPEYSDAMYSLKYGDNEWLFSKYPNLEPYSWWNPFIGGIQINIWGMNASFLQREKRTAEFVTVKDNFGTEWTGIKTTVTINEFTEHKGLTYEQYYVTQPSLAVLCYFVRFINNTGGYKHIGYDTNTYISGKDNLSDIYGFVKTDEKEEYRAKMGDTWLGADRLVKISFEGKITRDEKLYVYTDHSRNNGGIGINSDINQCNIYFNGNTNSLFNNTTRTFRPVFYILTEKEITLDSVVDLEKVIFDI